MPFIGEDLSILPMSEERIEHPDLKVFNVVGLGWLGSVAGYPFVEEPGWSGEEFLIKEGDGFLLA